MPKSVQKKFSRKVFFFVFVGGISFILDASILSFLIFELGWGRYISRVVSFLLAVPFSWLLNRILTFRETITDNRGREYTRYLVIQGAGALLNFVVYSACIFFSATMMSYPVLALAVGSIVAMVFNFIALQRFAFTGKSAVDTE